MNAAFENALTVIHPADFGVHITQEISREVSDMENSQNKKAKPEQQVQQEEDLSFDESVCSAEFSEGCTIPVSEQQAQP